MALAHLPFVSPEVQAGEQSRVEVRPLALPGLHSRPDVVDPLVLRPLQQMEWLHRYAPMVPVPALVPALDRGLYAVIC